jgi:hypothetical protein
LRPTTARVLDARRVLPQVRTAPLMTARQVSTTWRGHAHILEKLRPEVQAALCAAAARTAPDMDKHDVRTPAGHAVAAL